MRTALCVSCYKQEQINTLRTWAGPVRTQFCGIILFIHEPHVTPSSGKVKTKRHLFSFLLVEGHVFYTMCKLLEAGTTSHSVSVPSSGKLETKNTSFFVLASCRS